jgi:hypothetical protein
VTWAWGAGEVLLSGFTFPDLIPQGGLLFLKSCCEGAKYTEIKQLRIDIIRWEWDLQKGTRKVWDDQDDITSI